MMWELIAANRRKSLMLFIGMAVVLCSLGYLIGVVVHPDGGGRLGLIMAVAIWMGLSLMSTFGGGSLVLRLARAREVSPDVHPQLYNVVEEMKIAASLNHMPKIYIIDEKAPNAFATGLSPDDSAVAVTAGMLTRLNRDELQGVIAHEMSHIMNRDMQFMTLASIMLGTIVLMSDVFLRGMWFTGGGSSRRYRSSKSGGGGVPPQLAILAIALAILGPIFARLLYFAISRKREYLADACAVRLSRYPEGLASALEKISSNTLPLNAANRATAPMYIVNPLKPKKSALSGLGATHPPIHERIAILRAMSQGAGLESYQSAYAGIKGGSRPLIPASGLRDHSGVDIREAHVEPAKDESARKQTRDVMDLLRAVNGYAFLICACGLKLKVPPDFEEPKIACPRCKRENEIPKAQVSDITEAAAVVGAMVGTLAGGGAEEIPLATRARGAGAESDAPLEYRRRTNGWESFSCACGNLLQLSPAFSGSQIRCNKCDRVSRVI